MSTTSDDFGMYQKMFGEDDVNPLLTEPVQRAPPRKFAKRRCSDDVTFAERFKTVWYTEDDMPFADAYVWCPLPKSSDDMPFSELYSWSLKDDSPVEQLPVVRVIPHKSRSAFWSKVSRAKARRQARQQFHELARRIQHHVKTKTFRVYGRRHTDAMWYNEAYAEEYQELLSHQQQLRDFLDML